MAIIRTKQMQGMGRVDLTPSEYERLVTQKGYNATWEKATLCPYRSTHSPLAHDMTHTECDQGFVYYDPQPVRVLITGLSIRQQYMQQGRFDAGTAIGTFLSTNRVSFQDKITLSDSTTRFYELVTRATVGVTDKTKYPVVNVLDLRDGDRVYEEETDFTVDEGQIVWRSGGSAPAPGAMYSISYEHNVVYLVMDMAHDIRDTMTLGVGAFPGPEENYNKLPVQAVLRMHFLVRDQGLDPQTL